MKWFCDVLVVGGGGGAIRAAIAAKEAKPDSRVLLVTKGFFGHSGVTAISCSDRMAFHATLSYTEPGGADNWKYHADDVYRIGGKVSDYDLAEVLAKNAGKAFDQLVEWGVPFAFKEGKADQFVTDGSDYARACYTGPHTANDIEAALVKKAKTMAIEILEETMVAKLVKKDDRVVGALLIKGKENDPDKAVMEVVAGGVILATGGGGLIYGRNVFPQGMTGDGNGLAYESGAEAVNMEFIQLGVASTRTKFNCSGSMFRAIPRLVNDLGEEFLDKYLPVGTTPEEKFTIVFQKGASWPVSYEHKTHMIDIAIYQEMQAGRRVYMDYSANPEGFDFNKLPEAIKARYASEMRVDLGTEGRLSSPLVRLKEINQPTIDWFANLQIYIEKNEPVEVAVCGQHFQGGVKIDVQGRTRVPGLWAVGEVAGGQHGANRPGGNALMDCQVFGMIAGEDAAQTGEIPVGSEQIIAEAASSFKEELKQTAKDAVPTLVQRKRLQDLMDREASIVRTEAGLKAAIAEVESWKQPLSQDELGLMAQVETTQMLPLCEMVLRAALLRDESRGPHLRFTKREDIVPIGRKDGEWEKYIVVFKGAEDKMILEVREPHRPE